MIGLLPLLWRSLLALALALNPILGAGAAFSSMPEGSSAAAAAMPLCHDMAPGGIAEEGAPDRSDHGCDCGNPACEFAACCAIAALALPARPLLTAPERGNVEFADASRLEPQPPRSRAIRPPIA